MGCCCDCACDEPYRMMSSDRQSVEDAIELLYRLRTETPILWHADLFRAIERLEQLEGFEPAPKQSHQRLEYDKPVGGCVAHWPLRKPRAEKPFSLPPVLQWFKSQSRLLQS